ncbi:MAG: sugar phosphate isomerase/epimerase family protein [Mariniblastus sp.]
MNKETSDNHGRAISRRQFSFATAAGIAAAGFGGFDGFRPANAMAASELDGETEHRETKHGETDKIALGFDNFSIRGHGWKADRLIEFAAEQKLDSLLLSDLDVYESHDPKYLKGLKSKADDAGILLHAGTGSICPTAKRWDGKWGTAEVHLKLGIRIANQIGSPIFRCYLGGQADRQSDSGIQKHIATTVDVLKKVKTYAVDWNVKIAVENHAGDMQAWELVELIETAGKDFVGATLDSGNATWTLEHPLANLEMLGPYALSAGIRDSTIWETDKGCKVAWNAIGEGQVDWKAYTAKFAKLCPSVPFQLEIISGFNKPFNYKENKFWSAYPDAKARDFERFLELARAGKEIPSVERNNAEYQMDELLRSIRYCKSELGMGLKS